MTATLATGGRILSPVSRDASALAHENGVVTWVGQDAPGPALYPDAHRIDLNGDWVAPAFVEVLGRDLSEEGTSLGIVSAPLPAISAVVVVPALLGSRDRVVVSADDDLEGFASLLTAHAVSHGGPAVAHCVPTIVGVPTLADDILARLAAVGVVVVLRPLGGDDLSGHDLVRLASAGLVVAASAASGDAVRPWDAVRGLASVAGGRGLSPRAAFTALTRGARRAAGSRDDLAGTLAPGTPATYARWSTGELVVAAADDAVQRWSTDPRSGVPPMPDLDGSDPVLVGLTVDGSAVG